MTYHIRALDVDDIEKVYEIEQSVHIAPWDRSTLEVIHRLEGISLILEDDEKEVIGYLFCSTVIDEAHLLNIAIASDYQHQGLGRYLLTELMQRLKKRDFYSLLLEVRESNRVAYNLYENIGFNTVGRRKNYYPTSNNGREDAIVMAISFVL